jgi:trk system potassium uptake protein TrkH
MVLSLVVTIAVITGWMLMTTDTPFFEALRKVAFNVVSVVTTTGYATEDYTAWGPVAAVLFFLLIPVGGCTGSTAGGAKSMRWIIFARLTIERIRSIHAPHRVSVTRFEGRPVSDDVLAGVMSFFFFYIATLAAVSLALGLSGLDLTTAISGAFTAVANVGPGIGKIIGPAGNFAPLTGFEKSVLIFGMYVGRLEMLTVYVLFLPTFWREF